MAIRIEPNAEIVFGVVADAEVTATHGKLQKTGDTAVIKQLTAPVTAAVGRQLVMPINMLDLVFVAGDYPNGLMNDILSPYFSNEEITIDLLTDATTVVADSGYSQQTHDGWQLSTETD